MFLVLSMPSSMAYIAAAATASLRVCVGKAYTGLGTEQIYRVREAHFFSGEAERARLVFARWAWPRLSSGVCMYVCATRE